MKVKKKTNPIVHIISESDIQAMLHRLNAGKGLSKNQERYYKKTKYRDICIIKLMLYEGLTSKECAALNCSDLDESISTLQVRRSNDHYVIRLSKELQENFYNYLDSREEYIEEREKQNQEEALFINIQTKRISDRAIQIMVHNYSYDEYMDTSLTPNMLREYCILNKLKNGDNIIGIMRQFGYHSIASLEKYINALL